MIDEKFNSDSREQFYAYLAAKKLRKTPERSAILEKVLEINGHFNVDQLYQIFEGSSYHVSLATLYNTLDLLNECGIVCKLQFGNKKAQYEKANISAGHHHLICNCCGKIKEVKDADFLGYMKTKKYSGFTTSYFSLYVYGICNSCARKKKKQDKSSKTKD